MPSGPEAGSERYIIQSLRSYFVLLCFLLDLLSAKIVVIVTRHIKHESGAWLGTAVNKQPLMCPYDGQSNRCDLQCMHHRASTCMLACCWETNPLAAILQAFALTSVPVSCTAAHVKEGLLACVD